MNLKKFTGFITMIMVSLMMTLSCQENETLQKQTQTSYSFNGTEGGAIPLDVANRWINNYASQNPSGAKAHFFGHETIKKILATPGAKGIRIYYSLNESNDLELLMTGTDENGHDIYSTYGVKGVVTSTKLLGKNNDSFRGSEGSPLSFEMAKQRVANYINQNPLSTRAHFFGYEIVNQILSEKNCTGIRIYYALNDSGVPQLLLVGVRTGGSNILPASDGENYRTTGGADSATIGDMSYPCPTRC